MNEGKHRFQTQGDFKINGCSETCVKDEKVTRSLFLFCQNKDSIAVHLLA